MKTLSPMSIPNQKNKSLGNNFGIKLASCEADDKNEGTPMLTLNNSLIFEEIQSNKTNDSPTPLLRAKLKLGAYVNFANKAEIMEASDSESEHSLCDDVGDYDYFYKIRKMMDRLPEQNEPRYKYSLRKLFDSDLFQ